MRYQVYPKLKKLEGLELFNILAINWDTFKFNEGFREHTVTQIEALKPWLISFNQYGTVAFEDILFLINNISNPLELKAGMRLRIPEQSEIQAFIIDKRN